MAYDSETLFKFFPELKEPYSDDNIVKNVIEIAECSFNPKACGCVGDKMMYMLIAHYLVTMYPLDENGNIVASTDYDIPKVVQSESLGEASKSYADSIGLITLLGGENVASRYGRMFDNLAKTNCGGLGAILV